MQKIISVISILSICFFTGHAQTKPTAEPAKQVATTEKKAETAEVKWYTIEEAMVLTVKEPKKIFIDVYTDWCGWCKVMDKQTFSDPKVAAYLNKNFYSVKLNAEQKTAITFGGKQYNFIPENRSNELAIAFLGGKMSYPSTVYLDEKGQALTAIPGFQKPDAFFPILVFFAENHYTKTSWDDYSKTVWPERQKELLK